MKIVGAPENFYFNAHKVNGQIAAIDLGKAHGVLLCGDDRFRLPLFAAVDHVEHFLLRKTMVIREAL